MSTNSKALFDIAHSDQDLLEALALEKKRSEKLAFAYKELLEQFNSRTQTLENELEKRFIVETNLEEQQSFLRQIIDLNPNFIFAKNRNCEFTLVNKALSEAFGASSEDIIGKTDADFNTNQKEVEHFKKHDLDVMNSLKELIIPEEILTDVDGNKRYLRTVKRPIIGKDGKATHILGVASDITQLKKHEKKLEGLAEIIYSATDAIASVTCNGVIQSWNNAACNLFGYTEEEAIGSNISILCPEEFRDIIDTFMRTLIQGNTVKEVETKGVHKDGTTFHVQVSVSAFWNSENRITRVSAIARDISKRIATERELQIHRENLAKLVEERTRELAESQDRLRQAEKLAAMGALAAGIAHEINNPIGAILLTAENSLNAIRKIDSKREDSNSQIAKLAIRSSEKIIKNAHRCSLIVKEALKFARKKESEMWLTDINPLVDNAIHLVSQYATLKNSTITSKLDKSIPPTLLNPLDIEQLLVNLIKNSLDSSDSVTNIRISTELRNDHIALCVQDNGPGIPEEKLNRIFEPFYTSKTKTGGTGLGLNIVKQIVSAHHGQIHIESKVGVGTLFRIFFPVQKGRPLTKELTTSSTKI